MKFHISLIFFCLFSFSSLFSQTVYPMSNRTVDDCEGILTDSEMGPEPDLYDHNEDYTFTICVDEADEIILNFEFFATEATYDVLTIYEGPDKSGPVIAVLEGVIQPAPSFIINNECVTFHFKSDDNILANGWRMTWEVIIEEPKVPQLMINPPLDCPLGRTTFSFDCPVDCDLITAGNFGLIGPGGRQIADAIPVNCDPATNTTMEVDIVFDDSLRLPGIYRLSFEGEVQDACGEWHDIGSTVVFELSGCPIALDVYVTEEACEGDCGMIRADVIGGGSGPFTFEWSHTSDPRAEVEICADDTLVITVKVTDQNSASTTTTTFTYVPLPNPNITNKIGLDTFCSNRGDHRYASDLPGGRYYSRIIPAWEQERGRYQFWRWNTRDTTERDIIEYVGPNGCIDRDTIWIHPIYIGTEEAACLGATPWVVNGGTPDGGTWAGNHVSPDGTFDPSEVGEWTITFTAPNGCMRSKIIRVTDSIVMPDIDTICGGGRIEIRAEPFGGRWSGPFVQNWYLGRIDANRLTPNQSYTYYYDLQGCRDSIVLYVEEINAGSNRTMCSDMDIMTLNSTGPWTGPGTYLPALNAFDISDLPVGEHRYTLEKNGCTDGFRLYIVDVAIEEESTLEFCQDDYWINVLDLITIEPDDGDMVAPFLKDSNDTWYFNPSRLPAGDHLIQLDALGCFDSMYISIEGPADIENAFFCELDDARDLLVDPPGGTWSGPGILDPQTGLFDPQLVGVGTHIVTYVSPLGCQTQDTVNVTPFMQAEISGLEQIYCYKDTVVNVAITPPGGQLTINGQISPPSFNPSILGPGSHEVFYQSGSGDCASNDRLFITVLFPIEGDIMATDDSLCLGESTVIEIQPTGGRGSLTATWDQGLDFGVSHIVSPQNTTVYQVLVVDGCSVDLRDSIEIYVHPEFDVDFNEGPEVCFDEETYIDVTPPSDGRNYVFVWEEDPTINESRFTGAPGAYDLTIIQEKSGCKQDYNVFLPGAAPIKANFSVIPNGQCIDVIENTIEIIDLATGYTEGSMTFGDTSAAIDLILDELVHQYTEPGEYEIVQIVENELGCTDTFSVTVCVENKVKVFVPNIFSPNGDDKNDVLELFAFGVDQVEWQIFDRWGEMVFISNDKMAVWDGTLDGQKLTPGAFVLVMTYVDSESGFPYRHTQSISMIH